MIFSFESVSNVTMRSEFLPSKQPVFTISTEKGMQSDSSDTHLIKAVDAIPTTLHTEADPTLLCGPVGVNEDEWFGRDPLHSRESFWSCGQSSNAVGSIIRKFDFG
jgi:hypothetical protein